MAAPARSAALKVDWAKLTQSLGLRGATLNSLNSFKARSDEARRRVQVLSDLPADVDFAHYRSVLKNQAVVDEIEKAVTSFQVKKVDIARQLKTIEAFEASAVKSAEETKGVVEQELKDLERTLGNIEGARPFEELTLVCTLKAQGLTAQDDVMSAQSEIDERVTQMVSRQKWMPPGYREKFGDLAVV